MENVPGIYEAHNGPSSDFEEIVNALEALGYSWAARLIDAAAFGAPMRRERVFLVATKHGAFPPDILFAGAPGPCGNGGDSCGKCAQW